MRNQATIADRGGKAVVNTAMLVLLAGALAFSPAFGAALAGAKPSPTKGPLRVHPDNPRYFTDGSGKAIYLTGSHTWNNLKDMGPTDPPAVFDFDSYLNFLE